MKLAFAIALSLTGCVAEVADEEGGSVADSLSADDCYPRGNPYNCKPPAATADRPRIRNPDNGWSEEWPIRAGSPLMDGLGHVRGNVSASSVKINVGQRKILHDAPVVYAFATRLDTGISASGWIFEDHLVHAATLRRRMPTLGLPDPGEGEYEAHWLVTGGDNARFEGLKVNRGFSGGGREATDYLLRPGNVVNLIYSVPGHELGGFSVDTFPPGVVFRRSRGVNQIPVPLYRPGGTTAVSEMAFVYGFIDDGYTRRFGWIAREAMTLPPIPPAPPPPEPTPPPSTPPMSTSGECAVRCCDGSLSIFTTTTAAQCRESYGVCASHERVNRMAFNGAYIYERSTPCEGRYCCALCTNRDAYHRVDAASECTAHARDYCSVNDRGGLRDADWRDCAP